MRSHYCGDLRASESGQEVEIYGWVHRRRDHGGVIFLDVRDRTGVLQVVFDPDEEESFALADSVRNEYVLMAKGEVRPRPEGTVNPDMPTGEVEVLGKELKILNAAKTPPFQLDEYSEAGEDIRLRYRYMDLRRPEMQQRMQARARITSAVRSYLEEQGFWDIETPTLSRATPEGARDYLVPSRTHPGEFFALPQSPQVYKQLLMMSGMDKYYQIARCYRDEDLRADRQPEFTQIDIEASFINQSDIMSLTEGMLRAVFSSVIQVELPEFPVLSWADAMRDYGSDRPDLRNPSAFSRCGRPLRQRRVQGFQWPGQRSQGARGRSQSARCCDSVSQDDRRLYRFRRPLRCQGVSLHQGQRFGRRHGRFAVADFEVHSRGGDKSGTR